MKRFIFIGCVILSAVFLLASVIVHGQQATVDVQLRIVLTDPNGLPVPGAVCTLFRSSDSKTPIATGSTDEQGIINFTLHSSGPFLVHIEKTGFQILTKDNVSITGTAINELKLSMAISAVEENVTVTAKSEPDASVQSGASTPNGNLQRNSIQKAPLPSANVTDALPLIPGVVRSGTGEISIKGANESQSSLLINGLNASDPATGNFRLNLPIDSVEAVQVFQHPYTAQYGGFIGGVTKVETRRGDNQWHFELNDFLPDFRFRNGSLMGIAEDTPHLNFNGPLIKDRLYLSQSASYDISKLPIRGLAFPNNETKTESVSTYTQLDFIVNGDHSETFTFGHFPEKIRYAGLDFFTPQPVTPNYKQKDYFFTAKDNLSIFGGVLESAISTKSFSANVWGQGTADQVLTPGIESGNYFITQNRESHRFEILSYFTRPVKEFLFGSHEFKFGIDINRVNNNLDFTSRPVDILRADGTLAERITFDSTLPFTASNGEYIAFIQDRWLLKPNLSIDIGLRYEDQQIADELNAAPRAGFAWSPTKDEKTVIRGGIGVFYDKVPLNIRSFGRYPGRFVTTFGPDGTTVLDFHHFRNILVDSAPIEPLDFRHPDKNGGFVPQNVTWSLEADRIINSWMQIRASYTHSNTKHIYIVNPELDFRGKTGIVLRSAGEATYHAFELTAKFKLPKNNTFYTSYVKSRARGDLNDFNTYFGDFGAPVIRPTQYSNLPFDVPNRLIAWGDVGLPKKISLSPIVEFRSGFPYSVVDELQNFVGTRNSDQTRFPKFFALDMEVAKEFQLTKKYGVRLSVRGFNLTDHFNPRNVFANTANPLFGQFFAPYHRYFTGGFDVLF
ncbi:MAG TPA: TonB-dependent receptor plug domain-containing protein [Blastocatellia bacterium]|nr:TonB-dependent receptor plug domain-containing protein [Blastocatellia bacterium]